MVSVHAAPEDHVSGELDGGHPGSVVLPHPALRRHHRSAAADEKGEGSPEQVDAGVPSGVLDREQEVGGRKHGVHASGQHSLA